MLCYLGQAHRHFLSSPLRKRYHIYKMLRVHSHCLVFVFDSPLLEVLGRGCFSGAIKIVFIFYNNHGFNTNDSHNILLYSELTSRFSAIQANRCQYFTESRLCEKKNKEFQGCQDNQYCGWSVCCLLVAEFGDFFYSLRRDYNIDFLQGLDTSRSTLHDFIGNQPVGVLLAKRRVLPSFNWYFPIF